MSKPVLFSGRSRKAKIHVLKSRDGGKTVAECGARITTQPLFYGRGVHDCPHCTLVVK